MKPISIVSCLSKVLERLVLKRWILPNVKSKMDSSQFAYVSRPGAGTTPAVTILYHKVLEFLDGKSGAVRLLSIGLSLSPVYVSSSDVILSVNSILLWGVTFTSQVI